MPDLPTATPSPIAAASQPPVHRTRAHAAAHAIESNRTHLHFTVADLTVDISMPPLDKLAFYGGLAGAASFGLVTWPIALLTGVGHLLSEDRNSRTLRALGTALDAAT